MAGVCSSCSVDKRIDGASLPVPVFFSLLVLGGLANFTREKSSTLSTRDQHKEVSYMITALFSLIESDKLSPVELEILLYLYGRAGLEEDWTVYTTHVQKTTGISIVAVKKTLVKFNEWGLIRRDESEDHRSKPYSFAPDFYERVDHLFGPVKVATKSTKKKSGLEVISGGKSQNESTLEKIRRVREGS